MAYGKAPHHRGNHDRIAKAVVTAANAQPDYQCPSCGLTRAQGIERWGENGRWEGGHRVHGDPRYGYHAQHRHCNRSEGAAHGNRRRRQPSSGWLA